MSRNWRQYDAAAVLGGESDVSTVSRQEFSTDSTLRSSSPRTPDYLLRSSSPRAPGSEFTLPQNSADNHLAQAELVRSELRDIIDARSTRGVSEIYQQRLLTLLHSRAKNNSVWMNALRCPSGDQDIPLIECTKCGQQAMVEWILTDLNLSKAEHKMLIEHPGRYGRNAIQHGVRLKQWSSVNRLIRHGANIGFTGDEIGVVDAIVKAAGQQKSQHGSWRWMDKPLSDVFATCCFLYGDKWATERPHARGSIEVGVSRRFGTQSTQSGLRNSSISSSEGYESSQRYRSGGRRQSQASTSSPSNRKSMHQVSSRDSIVTPSARNRQTRSPRKKPSHESLPQARHVSPVRPARSVPEPDMDLERAYSPVRPRQRKPLIPQDSPALAAFGPTGGLSQMKHFNTYPELAKMHPQRKNTGPANV